MTTKSLLIFTVIYLASLITPIPTQAQTYLNQGDPAPHNGVLLKTSEAAKLAADLVNTKLQLTLCESSLTTCQDNTIEKIDETIGNCNESVRDLEDIVISEPTDVEVIPWWIWVGVGAAFGVGFGIGLAL